MHTHDHQFAASAIDAIGRCAGNINEVTDVCLSGLVSLMASKSGALLLLLIIIIIIIIITYLWTHIFRNGGRPVGVRDQTSAAATAGHARRHPHFDGQADWYGQGIAPIISIIIFAIWKIDIIIFKKVKIIVDYQIRIIKIGRTKKS